MRRGFLFTFAALLTLGATAAVLYLKPRDLSGFAEASKAQMVRIKGGNFMAGIYDSPLMIGADKKEPLPVAGTGDALPPYDATVSSFLLQARETTWGELNIFMDERGIAKDPQLNLNSEPAAPDLPAYTDWQTASDYCEWLGELTGLPLRLPTEVEWEYAARSGGLLVPWPTDDGQFRPGRNAPTDSFEERAKSERVGSFPPNPAGFYDMLAGQREWVSDRAPSDPKLSHIQKGSNNQSDLAYATIPTRVVVEPVPAQLIEIMESRGLRVEKERPFYLGGGIRCAADGDRHVVPQ